MFKIKLDKNRVNRFENIQKWIRISILPFGDLAVRDGHGGIDLTSIGWNAMLSHTHIACPLSSILFCFLSISSLFLHVTCVLCVVCECSRRNIYRWQWHSSDFQPRPSALEIIYCVPEIMLLCFRIHTTDCHTRGQTIHSMYSRAHSFAFAVIASHHVLCCCRRRRWVYAIEWINQAYSCLLLDVHVRLRLFAKQTLTHTHAQSMYLRNTFAQFHFLSISSTSRLLHSVFLPFFLSPIYSLHYIHFALLCFYSERRQ